MSGLLSRSLSVSIVLAVGAAAYGQPRERDVWHAYLADGQRYGGVHTTVTKLPDGNFRYAVESRVLIDLFGAQKQEMTGRTEYVVTPGYEPVSMTSTRRLASGEISASARARDGSLHITTESGDSKHTRTIDLTGGLIPEVCLDDWLHEQSADREKATVRVFRDEGWSVETVTLTRRSRDASGSLWHVEPAGEIGRGTVAFDADGIMRETQLEVPKMHLRRCTAEQAADIDYRVLDGRYVLTFPLDADISGPERLTELTVKLTWKDIPLEQFELEDWRQRLLVKSERGGDYEAILRIDPPRELKSDHSYPCDDKKLAPYLAETHFIKPKHEGIAAAARKVVADKKTALAAVRALSKWVHGYIEGALIAETLSGPDVLARQTGKCSEYSTLFASLARSVGIPARIALGERMVAGQWMGHMWNEAYVGEWIPVDASSNEVGHTFALLKFIHSDSVMGTQSLRWALTDSLDISIESFKLRPSKLAEKYRTGIEGNVYTNTDFACRLTAPVKDWTIADKSKPGVVTIRFRIPDRDDVNIHFVAFGLPPGTEPKTIIDARQNLFRGRYEDFAVQMDEACDVDGAKGHTIRFRRAALGDETKPMLTTEVVWQRGSFGYLLNLIADEQAHEEYAPRFQKLLAGYEYLKDE